MDDNACASISENQKNRLEIIEEATGEGLNAKHLTIISSISFQRYIN